MNAPCWNASIAEWLGGLFMAPLSTDAVASYRAGLGSTLLDALDDEPGAAPGIRRMRLALLTAGSISEIQRGLAAAFTQLFDGVAGPKTVSLYESTRFGGSGRLFQNPVTDMNRLMRQLDLSTEDAFREPADHLSIELALLGRLLRQGSSQKAETALLDDRLLAWVPGFSRECDAADRTGFYAGAADVLTAFLLRRRMKLRRDDGLDQRPDTGPGTHRALNRSTGGMTCRSE